MNEQTRIRLAIIEAKYGKRGSRDDGGDPQGPRRFAEDFRRARAEVLAPILEEIGAALTAAGHGHRVDIDGGATQPSVELHVLLGERECEPSGIIRLFARGQEIIAEVQLGRTEVELTRFHEVSALTPDVVEQMVVDAVEQVFACHRSRA